MAPGGIPLHAVDSRGVVTAVVVAALTVFSMQTKYDLTDKGGYLFGANKHALNLGCLISPSSPSNNALICAPACADTRQNSG